MVDVAVHDIIGSSRLQDAPEIARISQGLRRRQAGKYPCSKGANFFVIGCRLLGMDDEVHFILTTVGMSQELHQPGFGTAPVQLAQYMQDAHQARLRFWIARSSTK